MKRIEQILQEFDKILIDKNRINYNKLQIPLRNEKIRQYLNELNVDDESLEKFYKWKNGFNPDNEIIGACQIFEYDSMLPLEWIFEKFKINEIDPIWSNSFIPIITDGTGQFLLFNNKNGKDYGKIHLYTASMPFEEEPISYYDSIAAMIETTIEAYDQDILKYDQGEDWLNIDILRFHEIAKQLNKNSKYWKLRK